MAEPSRGRPTARRAALLVVLALVAALAGGGVAWAWWQGEGTATAPDTAITAGTVDVQVVGLGNGLVGRGGSVTAPALGVTGAVPGSGDSEIVTVRNGGSRATRVTVTPTRTGTLGTAFGTSASFGATDTGIGCSTGSGATATIPAGGTATLCVAVALSATAPSAVQGQAGTVSLALAATIPGTSWTDTGTVVSGAVGAATVPAPTLSCGVLGLGSVSFTWTAVPSASRYQFVTSASPTPVQVLAPTTSYQATGVANNATARVRAERVFTGEVVWTSVPSNARTYSIALGLLGVCS